MHREHHIKSDFTSQSSVMIEKMAEREIGKRISEMSGLNPSKTIMDLIIEQHSKEGKADSPSMWSTMDKNDHEICIGHSPKQIS